MTPERSSLLVDGVHRVSTLWLAPRSARACYVLAHGAGAGMTHPFLEAVARELADRGVATLRYQFPFMEQGSKRPDALPLAQATVRAAVAQAQRSTTLPLVAGGKSFGGRVTSRTQSDAPLPGVRGLAFLGFPLHPTGKPSAARGEHLGEVRLPMLFLQGTRDALAEPDEMRALQERLAERATLTFIEGADHSFHVAARSGRTDAGVRAELMDALVAWVDEIVARPGPDEPAAIGQDARGAA